MGLASNGHVGDAYHKVRFTAAYANYYTGDCFISVHINTHADTYVDAHCVTREKSLTMKALPGLVQSRLNA
jgi:hypothetical protein